MIPSELREIPLLRGLADAEALQALAGRCRQRNSSPETCRRPRRPRGELLLVAHGRLRRLGRGKYGDETLLGTLADGDHAGDAVLTPRPGRWPCALQADTRCTLLALTAEDLARRPRTSPRAARASRPDGRPQARAHRTGGERPRSHSPPGTRARPSCRERSSDYELSPAPVRAERRADCAAGAQPGRGPLQPPDEPGRGAAAADRGGVARASGVRAGEQPGVRPAAQRRPQAAHPHPLRAAHARRPRRARLTPAQDAVPARPPQGGGGHRTGVQPPRDCVRRTPRSTDSGCAAGAASRCCRATRSRCNGGSTAVLAMRTGQEHQGVVGLRPDRTARGDTSPG